MEPIRTVFYEQHKNAGAKMVDFHGFEMPIQYSGIMAEHLATRKYAGLFDISHMGRFLISGKKAIDFLQYTLSNNVYALKEVYTAQYHIIPDEKGGAIDDSYLYRIGENKFMLVVNAANRQKDWQWLSQFTAKFEVQMEDISENMGMLSLQGPHGEKILTKILMQKGNGGRLPDNQKNQLSVVEIGEKEVIISRTGYTGDPIGFEIFMPAEIAPSLWQELLQVGQEHQLIPIGLGARDTLRLEANFPLYGHELGEDLQGNAIPIFALPLGRVATRFDAGKGEFIGKKALYAQYLEVRETLKNNGTGKPLEERLVPKLIWPFAMLNKTEDGPGIQAPRQGFEIYQKETHIGWVTSGSPVPNWKFSGEGLLSTHSEESSKRALGIAYVDSNIIPSNYGEKIAIHKPKGKSFTPLAALLVKTNMRAAAPYARPVIYPEKCGNPYQTPQIQGKNLLKDLVEKAVDNHTHRQQRCINLIPSEQTPSLVVRLLSVLDPVGRYAEHKQILAFGRDVKDVFYYQGTKFIEKVEEAISAFFKEYLGCSEVETKPIAGQLANASVFGGLVDYFNRFSKEERKRLKYVLNNHLRKGGHLSAQMGGALKHFVSRDPITGQSAVAAFPVDPDNFYKMDVKATLELIERYKPQLLILGKSMFIHPEPVAQLAAAIKDMPQRPFLMYDAAHVLGILGPHFQDPFKEGADLLTGSTHKTFFGTQRGIIASNFTEDSPQWALWQKISNNVFPGSMSNHHLGSMLGLLGACYEMLAYRYPYQKQVIQNAKAFALALKENGVSVEGDPQEQYTQTHQVILRVAKAKGPEIADRLEKNHLLVNYQGLPDDSGFSDASGIRLGVQEMTRFGMKEKDFRELAGYMAEVILEDKKVAQKVTEFRGKFVEMKYCMDKEASLNLVAQLKDDSP